jgi:hypothetical protein
MLRFSLSDNSWATASIAALALLAAISPTLAVETVQYLDPTTQVTRILSNARAPALYSGDFGDCLGGTSLFNITSFDAAYYKDNSTVLFHMGGSTSLRNQSIMSRSHRIAE